MIGAGVGGGRIEEMDLLRGLAIVCVTFNHAIVFSSTDLAIPPLAVVADEILAPVRMPLMVFLSGLLVAPSLARGTRSYLIGKARRVLYPYFVWSAIVLAVIAFVPALASESFEWTDVLRVFYDPLIHLWFLYDLFLFYVVVWATRAISPMWIAAVSIVAAAISQDYGIGRFCFLLTFFALGVWASRNPHRWMLLVRNRLTLAIAALVCVGTGVIIATLGPDLRYAVVAVPFAASGILVAIAVATPLRRVRVAAPVRFVGRNSLVFYLVHWYPTLAAVVFVTALGSGWIAIGAGVVAGLASGVLFCGLVRVAPPVNRLFALPRPSGRSGLSRERDSIS